jgi:tRNA-dihydrouridine synthase B
LQKPILKIAGISIENAVILAPMEGITDLPFRLICKELGADIVYSEFIAAEALIRDAAKSFAKMKITEKERPVVIQIFGSKKESMVEAAKIVEDAGADILDINFGCWVKKVVNNNSGAAFLKTPERMGELINAISNTISIPVTAKTRLGWDKNSIVIIDVAQMMEQAGCKALAVHCRTRDMGMKGEADWSWGAKIKSVLEDMPLIINGDIKTAYDAKSAFLETGADGIMIGRASVGNPFLFKQVKEYLNEGKEPGDISFSDSLSICKKHLDMTIEQKGIPRGIFEFRKHYSGYLKGLHGASHVRQKLVEILEYDEIVSTLKKYEEYLEKRTKDA